jgi:SAM-dependent methyltransferase
MRSIDYDSWAKYLAMVHDGYGGRFGSALELAAGSGNISLRLAPRFKEYVSADLSWDMLAAKEIDGAARVACDMTAPPFDREFDAVFVAFDSVNYLLENDQVVAFFDEAARLAGVGGLLHFDASLERNSLRHTKPKRSRRQSNGVAYEQISRYDRRTKIHTNTFTIEASNQPRVVERHRQRIYSVKEIVELIGASDLELIDCLEGFTFRGCREEGTRAQFIARKEY